MRGSAGLALVLGVSVSILLLTSSPAGAWKPKHHVYTGNEAISEILSGQDCVTIGGTEYAVIPEVAQAIRNYPQFYRGGCVGPDGFPDIVFGGSIIHPDWKAEGGTYAHEWLAHVYYSAWDYYSERNGDEAGQQALAFSYGFLTHAGGDMWGHTLINDFAGGSWPDIPGGDVNVAVRHVIVEQYIADHVPGSDLSIDAPLDFIYRAFIDRHNQASKDLARASDIPFGIPYFTKLRERLVDRREAIHCDWWDPTEWIDCLKKAYVGAWIDDIDDGLEAWPGRMRDTARLLLVDDGFEGTIESLEEFGYERLLSMYGAPDFVGGGLEASGIGDLAIYLAQKKYGISLDELKEYFKHPGDYINSPPLFESDTSARLDALMHVSGGVFDPEQFAANKNTIVLAKMILLSPQTLNRLLADRGVSALYGGENPSVPPEMQDNVMLGFIRTLDGDHQWRKYSLEPPNLQHSEGMPLWVSCQAREAVFRTLFADWEADGFPDLGETCIEAGVEGSDARDTAKRAASM